MADAQKTEEKSGGKNLGKILQIVFAVVNLAVTGGGAFLVYKSTLGWQSPIITEAQMMSDLKQEMKEDESRPYIYTMDKFVVNLGGQPQRTIRLEVNLEMLGKDGFEEVLDRENKAKTRDKILTLLNEKNFSELESIQGKLFLKDRIAFEVNSLLRKGVVKDVFFTDFVVQ